MALREKVLRKKVEKLELKGSKIHKVEPEKLIGFETLLQDVFLILRPKPDDYQNRRNLIRVFNTIAKELYGRTYPAVKEFGSFVMDLFSPTSDLDLSINFSDDVAEYPRDMRIKTLRKFAKKFYALQRKGHVLGVQPIFTARVPILKIIDAGTGIECDISVENKDGILKSEIVYMISLIDYRFQKLCFLMKAWAKARNINSSKDGTLNSLSIILLVTFHLQTRDPPILPPLSALFKDGTNAASVMKLVNHYLDYGKGNNESLASLFVTLLIKLSSVSTLWSKGLCASTYHGAWISKTWDSKVGCISVEDFTDRSQNVARAVKEQEIQKINHSIELSIIYIFDFMNGSRQEVKLREFLFGCGATNCTPTNTGSTLDNGNNAKLHHLKQPCNVWEGRQQTIYLDPTLIRGMPDTKAFERLATNYVGTTGQIPAVVEGEKWGVTTREALDRTHWVMQSDRPLMKKMRTSESWEGKTAENWIATSDVSWAGTSTGSWGGTSTGSWEGTSTGSWGKSQVPSIKSTWTENMPPTAGWEGKVNWSRMQPTSGTGPIWSREMQDAGVWENSRRAN